MVLLPLHPDARSRRRRGIYSVPIITLVCGRESRPPTIALVTLAVLSVLAWRSTEVAFTKAHAFQTARMPMTDIRATSAEAAELARAIESSHGRHLLVLSQFGNVNLYGEFERPVALYLLPGLANDGDISREVALLQRTDAVIVPEMQVGEAFPISRRFEVRSTTSSSRLAATIFRSMCAGDAKGSAQTEPLPANK